MSTYTTSAGQLACVSRPAYSAWSASGAMQGSTEGNTYPRVGAMRFPYIRSIVWADQVISAVRLKLTYSAAGLNAAKTLYLYRGARSGISGTGAGMLGAYIGAVGSNGSAYNGTRTAVLSAGANAAAFAGIVDWLQNGETDTLVLYRDEQPAGYAWSANYLQIKAAEISVDYEPRGSKGTLDRDAVDAGQEIVLTIEPLEAGGEISHTVQWMLGARAGDAVSLAAGETRTAFTVPMEWLDQIPDSASGTACCLLTTLEDGEVSAVRELAFTVRAPADVVPSFTAAIAPVGTVGGYWQHIGGAEISFTNVSAPYGASITGYSIAGAEDFTASAQVAQTPDFALSGAHDYLLTLTDSRGRTASQAVCADVQALAGPRIDAFRVQRYAARIDDEGETVYVEDPGGAKVWVTVDAQIDIADGSNPAAAYILYGPAGGTLAQRIDLAWPAGQAAYAASDDRTLLTQDVPLDAAWEFRLVVADGHASAMRTARAEKSAAIMHFAGTGYGVAVGGYSGGTMADKRFDVAQGWSAHFGGGVWGAMGYRMDRCMKAEALTVSGSVSASAQEGAAPSVMRAGPIVFMYGTVVAGADIAAGASEVFAQLPGWAWPAGQITAIQQGADTAVWWLAVNTRGQAAFGRYRSGGAYAGIAAGSALPFCAMWIAADAMVREYAVTAAYERAEPDNTSATACEGEAYVVRLTPQTGTEITDARVTMGGADITGWAYTRNLIHIPVVTGDIAIEILAEETPAALIRVTDDGDGNVTAQEVIEGSLTHTADDGDVVVTKYATAAAGDDGDGNVTLE